MNTFLVIYGLDGSGGVLKFNERRAPSIERQEEEEEGGRQDQAMQDILSTGCVFYIPCYDAQTCVPGKLDFLYTYNKDRNSTLEP